MQADSKDAAIIAQRYTKSPTPLKLLGSGMGGVVFLAPDLRTAIKVHHQAESYATEVEAYKRIVAAGITKVRGLTVPKPRFRVDQWLLIQMDFVSPPFLLDFAGVLFKPPDFDSDAIAGWHANLEFLFGRNVSIVYEVYHLLARHLLHGLPAEQHQARGVAGLRRDTRRRRRRDLSGWRAPFKL